MDKHTIKPTTVRLELADKQAIETIKHLYGCPSDVAAIRLAIRIVARQEVYPLLHSGHRNAPSIPAAKAGILRRGLISTSIPTERRAFQIFAGKGWCLHGDQ